MQDNRPTALGVQVHEAVGARSDADFLPQLKLVLGERDPGRRGEHLGRLASVLHESPPFRIYEEVKRRTDVESCHRFERNPSWSYGTTTSRLLVIEELLALAAAAQATSATNARQLALGALLLAGQEGCFAGGAAISRVLSSPVCQATVELPSEQIARLRESISANARETASAAGPLATVANVFSLLFNDSSTVWDTPSSDIIRALDALASLAQKYPNIAWRLANLAWRFKCFAQARNQPAAAEAITHAIDRWQKLMPDVDAQRWFAEAANRPGPAPRSAGIKVLTAAALASRINGRR